MGDFFFNMTEWLRTTFLLDAAFWMEETGISRVMVENFWGVPLVQVLHILAIGAGFGATLMLTLRVNNMGAKGIAMPVVEARYVPWIWWSLVVIVFSGFLMLMAEPVRNMINGVFWVKMIALVVTLLITLAFQRRVRTQALAGGIGWQAGSGTRATSWLILILWCVIMACGRWIAYAPV
ncbi:MAG: hypothetical protein JY451_00935 [Erythrobacter sp.]|nr:MAG: hypothetical protein JY451_00935 [Erythrobacter sp.]